MTSIIRGPVAFNKTHVLALQGLPHFPISLSGAFIYQSWRHLGVLLLKFVNGHTSSTRRAKEFNNTLFKYLEHMNRWEQYPKFEDTAQLPLVDLILVKNHETETHITTVGRAAGKYTSGCLALKY